MTEEERKIDAIKVCGANRGPHNYIPVGWVKSDKEKHVTTLLCTVCFNRVSMQTLYEQFQDVSIYKTKR